ncbi:MAG: DUF3179 domain-containing protein [Nitrososphaerota archaeon]
MEGLSRDMRPLYIPLIVASVAVAVLFVAMVPQFPKITTSLEKLATQPEKTEKAVAQAQVTVMTTRLAGGVELRYVVSPDEIVSGGPPKDGIPSIDKPRFASAEQAESFMRADELVVGLYHKGVARAYPLKILVWHEIVNDVVAGDPIVVTYCPLCYTSTAFIRVLEGEPVEFGVSGKLYNSDLVMYDRKTDTYWSQIWGVAILGKLAGQALQRIQVDVMTWEKWKNLHPDTEVLTTETGFSRPYGRDPYAATGYYTDTQIWFPVKNRDDRLHPKAIVHGIIIGGKVKVYEEKSIANAKLMNDNVAETPILVVSPMEQFVRAYSRVVDGHVLEFEWRGDKIFDKQTGSEWSVYGEAVAGPLKGKSLQQIVVFPGFWFAWVAFFPSLKLYSGNM